MIDITRPLAAETATWPGDARFELEWARQLSEGDNVSVSRIKLSPHVGTHADAPAHYEIGGATAGEFDLSSFLGRARVIDLRGRKLVTAELLAESGALGCERVLVRSLDEVRPEEFVSDYAPLTPEGAEALVASGLLLYGTDSPSVDPIVSAAMGAHRVLGAAGVPILENLDLSHAEAGDYDLVALPLRLAEAEAAPVRALLLPAGTLRLAR
jgi:arylformamidase